VVFPSLKLYLLHCHDSVSSLSTVETGCATWSCGWH